MTTEELAEELYHLVVIRGHWKGTPPRLSLTNGEYNSLPDFVKDAWLIKAVEFASENKFTLDD